MLLLTQAFREANPDKVKANNGKWAAIRKELVSFFTLERLLLLLFLSLFLFLFLFVGSPFRSLSREATEMIL
jgi:hypothetical protein